VERFLRREMVEHVLRWCALGLAFAAIVSGIASVKYGGDGDVIASASLIVAAVVLGLAVYICIAIMGFMDARHRLRKIIRPIK
jgi:hypothetical protein